MWPSTGGNNDKDSEEDESQQQQQQTQQQQQQPSMWRGITGMFSSIFWQPPSSSRSSSISQGVGRPPIEPDDDESDDDDDDVRSKNKRPAPSSYWDGAEEEEREPSYWDGADDSNDDDNNNVSNQEKFPGSPKPAAAAAAAAASKKQHLAKDEKGISVKGGRSASTGGPPFDVGQNVLALDSYRDKYYRANILDIRRLDDDSDSSNNECWRFHVHFSGWSKRYDEWVPQENIMADTPGNRALVEAAAAAVAAEADDESTETEEQPAKKKAKKKDVDLKKTPSFLREKQDSSEDDSASGISSPSGSDAETGSWKEDETSSEISSTTERGVSQKDTKRPRRRRNRDANELYLQQEQQQQQAQRKEQLQNYIVHATCLVAESLQSGPWPSPLRYLGSSSVADPDEHLEYMCIVGASLQQFARDVVVPSFVAEWNGSSSSSSARQPPQPPQESRVMLGTWLLLREILMQNFRAIFGSSAVLTGQEPEFLTSVVSMESPAEFARDDMDETALFSAKTLVTAVILFAIELLPSESKYSLKDDFLRLVVQYDNGDDEFETFLEPVDRNVIAQLPGGAPLGENERVAWQISYNLNRASHPLLTNNHKRKYETLNRMAGGGQPVESTAVHVTILEEQRH